MASDANYTNTKGSFKETIKVKISKPYTLNPKKNQKLIFQSQNPDSKKTVFIWHLRIV